MDSIIATIPWPILVLLGYIFVMSVITFLTFATDKSYALDGAWRTREKTLLLLSFLGGAPGAILAMKQFRHKTRKVSFISKFVVVVIAQLAIAAAIWFLVMRFGAAE